MCDVVRLRKIKKGEISNKKKQVFQIITYFKEDGNTIKVMIANKSFNNYHVILSLHKIYIGGYKIASKAHMVHGSKVKKYEIMGSIMICTTLRST